MARQQRLPPSRPVALWIRRIWRVAAYGGAVLQGTLTSAQATALRKTTYVVGARNGLAVVFGDMDTGRSSLARLPHQTTLDDGFPSGLLRNLDYPTANSFRCTIAKKIGAPGHRRARSAATG